MKSVSSSVTVAAVAFAFGVSCSDTSGRSEINSKKENLVSVKDSNFHGVHDEGRGETFFDSHGDVKIENFDAEVAVLANEKAPVVGNFQSNIPDIWQRLEQKLSEAKEEDSFTILVGFKDSVFDWSKFNSEKEDRSSLIDERKNNLNENVNKFSMYLKSLGYESEILWISSAVSVSLPTKKIKEIVNFPGVESIVIVSPIEFSGAPYNGSTARTNLRVDQMISQGLSGVQGNRLNSANPVRIGIADSATLLYNHLALQRVYWWGGTASVFDQIYYCPASGQGCFLNFAIQQGDSHGTQVSRIAVGSIESGQDPNFTLNTDRVTRSGISFQNNVRASYYGFVGGYSNVLQQALIDGVDIINFSNYPTDPNALCNTEYSPADNLAFFNALNAGLISVAAIGNNGVVAGTCTANYPAVRRDTVAVGALQSDDSISYNSTSMSVVSSGGGAAITTGGFTAIQGLSVADVVAPGRWDYWYRPNNNSYDVSNDSTGFTSYAAPVVTAAFGYLLHSFKNAGWSALGRDYIANFMLLGDGFSATTGGQKVSGLDRVSGMGRIKMHQPSSLDMTTPYEWNWGHDSISQGQTKSYGINGRNPIPSTATQLKFALTFDEFTYTNAADIDVAIYDICPQGGGSPVLVRQDTSYDLRIRIALSGSELRHSNGTGKCLEWRATAFTMPSGQSRMMHAAYYWHSGSVSSH